MKRYTKKIAILLAVIMSFCLAPSVQAASTPTLKIDGLLEAAQVAPVVRNGYTLIGTRDIFTALGAAVKWDYLKNQVNITKDDTTITITVGSTAVTVNGEKKYMPVPAENVGGSVMVPLRFVSETMGAEVNWDPDSNTITIDTGRTQMNVLRINQPSTDKPYRLTYQDALNSLISYNSNLSMLDETAAYLRDQRKTTYDTVIAGGLTDMSASLYGTYVTAERGIYSMDQTLATMDQQKTMIKDGCEYLLINNLTDIATTEMDVQMMEESYAVQQESYKQLLVKLSLGLVSQSDADTAKLNLDQSQTQLNTLQIGLDNMKGTINNMLHLSPDLEVIIDYTPQVKPLDVTNINSYAEQMINSAPTIALKQSDVKVAQYNLDGYTAAVSTDNQIDLQNKLSQAQRALSDAKTSLDQTIRSTYNQLLQLGQQEKSLQLDLQKAKDTYNTAAINYQAGNLTMLDVSNARLGILQTEIALAKNEYTYATLAYGFSKPYLLASSSSGS